MVKFWLSIPTLHNKIFISANFEQYNFGRFSLIFCQFQAKFFFAQNENENYIMQSGYGDETLYYNDFFRI